MRRFEKALSGEFRLTRIPVTPGVGGDPRVMYLQILDHVIRDHADLVRTKPNERFFDWLENEVTNYTTTGKVSSPEIATAIVNLADDLIAGREVTLRAGDYISLMKQAKMQKII